MLHPSPAVLRPLRRALLAASLALLLPVAAFAITGNGKLQIHHIDVGQGDGVLVISPNGQTALFDDGNYLSCTGIKNYLSGLGITVVDYHFCSHYHSDHLGCIDDLAAIGITIGTKGYDRGYSYSSGTYTAYVNTLGAKRATIAKDQIITLDAGATYPVQLKCVNLNGAGVYSPTGSDENAKSLVMLVSYGQFQEEIGGDLTGDGSTDVESTIGPQVGDVEVYKAHHHGSKYSNNDNWLNAIGAEVCVISCGNGNSYLHPTAEALGRMHAHGIHTYWTETGNGVAPNASWDKVGGTIVIQAQPGVGASYTVSGSGFTDTYYNGGSPPINTTQYPTALTMLKGSLATGDVTRLAVSDDSRIGVSAGVSAGAYWTDWYASCFLAHPPLNLTVTCETSFTISRTQELYAYNWSTAAWDLVNTATVSTTDVTKVWNTSSPANYVGPSNEVRFRVKSNTHTSSFTSRGDFMSFNYDYAAGTAPMASMVRDRREPEVDLAESGGLAHADDLSGEVAAIGTAGPPIALAEEGVPVGGPHKPVTPMGAVPAEGLSPQAMLRAVNAQPLANGARLDWSVGVNEHVDGFNIYRETEDRMLVFAGNDASLESHGDEVYFHFVDGDAPADATYWLGVRSCSAPEALIGPIRVEAAAAAVPVELALRIAPNPASGIARFEFALDQAADVTLEVFDLQGRRIATPLVGRVSPGTVHASWNLRRDDGGSAEPGLYFARLQVLGRTLFQRVTVVAR